MDSNVTEITVDEYQWALATLEKSFLEGIEVLNLLKSARIVDNCGTTETKQMRTNKKRGS
jgi:hypothetical protein